MIYIYYKLVLQSFPSTILFLNIHFLITLPVGIICFKGWIIKCWIRQCLRVIAIFFLSLGANEAELNGAYNIFPSRLPALAMLLNDENISQAENQWFEES